MAVLAGLLIYSRDPLFISLLVVAEILAVDRTTLTRNLKLVRDRGLVEKKRIALTARGRRSAAAALPLWESAQQQFVKSLGRRRCAAPARRAVGSQGIT
ncbi:MAG TPA: hypothetical protein VGA76_07355 [Candidatus Dormibacteraeota bacterium]